MSYITLKISHFSQCPLFYLKRSGIERNGMGNWKIIADFIGNNKTTKQVEEHYWELYMGTHGYCLPSRVLWKDQMVDTATLCPEITFAAENASSAVKEESSTASTAAPSLPAPSSDSSSATDLYRVPVNSGYTRGEVVRRDEGYTGLLGHSHPSKNTSKDKQELRDKLAQLPGSDLPGFFPLRGDFDNEYEVNINKCV